MARPRRRRLILSLVVLLLLAAIGGAVAYVLGVGRTRTDPFRRAIDARDAGDLAGAEAQLRGLLAVDSSHVRARDSLIGILTRSGRIEEAESFARHWLSSPDTEVLGLRTLSELAFRRNDVAAAVRFARMVSDRDPAFAQSMFVQVQDFLGSPSDLDASVRAAEALGMLARHPVARASAFLYAAETLRDLERTVPEGPRKAAYAERRARARAAALAADLTREDLNTPRQETHAEAVARSARIQLLASDKSERLAAVQRIEGILVQEPQLHSLRAALVGHYVAEGELARAANHAEFLHDGPPMYAIRAVSSLAGAGSRAAALKLLERAAAIPARVKDLLRARVQIAGQGPEREQGIEAFERIAVVQPLDVALVQEAFRMIRAAGDPVRALRLLDAAAAQEPKLRVPALIEAVAVASAAGSADLEQRLASLVAAAETPDLVVAFLRLQQIPKVGEPTAFAFLQKALDAGKADPLETRLLRASAAASRPGKAADGRAWSEHARDDLAAVIADPKASAQVLLRAAPLTRLTRAYRLFGTLLARVLTDATEGSRALALYLRAANDADVPSRDLAAQGMREAPAATGEFAPWTAALADALARGDTKPLRRPSGDRSVPPGRPQPIETLLQLELAGQATDWPEAEAFARGMLAAAPGAAEASERLGTVLVRAKKFEGVLKLHDHPTPTPAQRLQRIEAQWGLGRKQEAVAEARLMVRETEGGDRALIVLGWLLRDTDSGAALSTLASAAGNPEADVLRAEVLERRGEEDAAVQVYEDMLRASDDRSMVAWQGLAKVRAAQSADWKFIDRVTPVIEAPPRAMDEGELAFLVLQRGQAYDRRGQYEQALVDYRRAIKVFPRDAVALNNAAWLMGADLVRRTEDVATWNAQALDLADRAVAAAPTTAPIHHTRAKILLALKRPDDALAGFDRAIELLAADLTPERLANVATADAELLQGRLARYLLDKATLLEAKGDVDGAVVVYRKIRDEHPKTYQANLAKDALTRLGR
jgi:tetratricopeptide (TPR) repeat protein